MIRFCEMHWEDLRCRLDERGLLRWASKDSREAMARQLAERREGPKPSNFEPIAGACGAILANALDVAGQHLFDCPTSNGCPLCFLLAHCPCNGAPSCEYLEWTTNAAEEMHEKAASLGLIGSA